MKTFRFPIRFRFRILCFPCALAIAVDETLPVDLNRTKVSIHKAPNKILTSVFLFDLCVGQHDSCKSSDGEYRKSIVNFYLLV